jgi:PAS domain S-box-containing protein
MTLTALHNADGSIKGFLKVTRDLTDKKLAEDAHSNFVEELKQKNEQLKQSEERYHRMVSDVTDYAIILLDKEGKILDWNKGAEKLKGYSSPEIIGKNFRLFYPKEEKAKKLPETLLEQASRNGSVLHEGWRVKKNGERFWGSVAITALYNDSGDIIGFSKVTRDLTERKITEDRVGNLLEELKEANESLKESEQRYHKMIDEVEDYAIILLDVNGTILNWNTGAEVIKGYKASEILGKSFKIFYPPEALESKLPDRLLEEARSRGKVSHEGWRVRKNGSRFWGSVVITALHNLQGELIGFSKVTRDLTERKAAEDALRQSAAQLDLKNKTLERLNDELSSFTYIASHDLKEPLRKIQTFVSRIEDENPSVEKTREFIAKIKNSAVRMQKLIDDLLSYSHVSNDNMKFEEVDLNEILATLKVDLEVMITEKKAVIQSNNLPVVSGIKHEMHQLFLNLITNSIKFSKPSETPHITIQSRAIKGPDVPGEGIHSNRYHHISFKDNGIGFEPEFATQIFEAFQRLNPKEEYSGTGIGLAIVRKIVENHHGVVSAESFPGMGATFHVYLPIDL